MSVIVKGGLATAVLAMGCTGTYFLMAGSGPITLHKENKTLDTAYNNKIGSDFKHFLVSPFNPKNKSFWEKAFRKWQEESTKTNSNLSNDFKKDDKVKIAFTEDQTGTDGDKSKALNRVCHDLYKGKSKTELSVVESDADKKKLTTDIFAYCSILGGLPTVIQSPTDNTIGKTNQTKLVATEGNDTWWNLKHEEFLAGTAPDSSTEKFFKKLHDEAKGHKTANTLRNRCREAYAKTVSTSSGDDTPTSSEALKYCSLLGS